MSGLCSLPAELRAQIWQHCLPGPRHIIIAPRRHHPAPVVFHICHESRAEAQRHFDLVPSILETTSAKASPGHIWIDFSRDTICIASDWNPALGPATPTPTPTLHRARRLAFEFSPPQNFMQLLEILAPIHRHRAHLPDLREVILYSPPKKWFEDHHTGRVQERHPPLVNAREAAKILLRLLHMLFGGHAWLDSGAGIPPPLRWGFVCNAEASVWAGPFPDDAAGHDYVLRCAGTGEFEIQRMTWEQVCGLKRVQSAEPRVHDLVGCYEGCPEHPALRVA